MVLFPGAPVSLHIFEPRYQQMIRYCLSENRPFGVVLIRRGLEALGDLAEPHEIGCSAAIVETEPLGDGRLNISAVGIERFRIRSLDRRSPYLVGEVEKYPVRGQKDRALGSLAKRLRPWIQNYLGLISDQLPDQVETKYLPEDPIALAYIGAFLVQAPAAQKQVLLEKERMPEMLRTLIDLYRHESAILRALLSGGGPVEHGFGLN